MFVARLSIEAKFGHKQAVMDLMKKWDETVGKDVGLDTSKMRRLSGSIGAKEALFVEELEIESLAELEEAFAKIGQHPAHAAWGLELEPHVVSGSSKWEIFRLL